MSDCTRYMRHPVGTYLNFTVKKYCSVLFFNVQHCAVQSCTVLYCAILYCTVLYCTILNYTKLY